MLLLSRRRQRSWRKSLPSLREELRLAEEALGSHHIADTRLEAEFLLMHTLGIGKAEMYVRMEDPLPPAISEEFRCLVKRRCGHEPTAYILQNCQFYGIDLFIDPRALIPRPESELLVEEGMRFAGRHFPSSASCTIADVGTGSGAIAIALALQLPGAEIFAIDISATALEIARINCEQYQVTHRVHLLHGNMLQPIPKRVNAIIANLPYVTDSDLEELIPEIKDFEPRAALAGGPDGLDKIRQLLPHAVQQLLPGGMVLLEIGYGQAGAVTSMASSHFPEAKIDVFSDLGGISRVVKILN